MPPELPAVEPPKGRGRDAYDYLCRCGLIPRVPHVHSSYYESILSNPLMFYLTARLGLMPRLRWSKALNRGSWLHKAAELDPFTCALDDPAYTTAYFKVLSDRLVELNEICKASGIVGDARESILTREKQDAACALGWWNACAAVRVPQYGHLREWLRDPRRLVVGREIELTIPHPGSADAPSTVTLDLLLLDRATSLLHIVDYKTADMDLIDRLSTCSAEFQTAHYLFVLDKALKLGDLHALFPDLHEFGKLNVGGMIHVGIRKPAIDFGQNDRPFTEAAHVLKSGPRKGQTELRRTYHGEPSHPLYVARCQDWMLGRNNYADLLPERLKSPCCNISFTSSSDVLDGDALAEYSDRLEFVRDHCTRTPYPGNFPRSISSLRSFGKLHDLAPLVLTHPSKWPHIVKDLDLIQEFRD